MIESADAVARFIAGRKRDDLDDDLMRRRRRPGTTAIAWNRGRTRGLAPLRLDDSSGRRVDRSGLAARVVVSLNRAFGRGRRDRSAADLTAAVR
jgi:hypothetical protein